MQHPELELTAFSSNSCRQLICSEFKEATALPWLAKGTDVYKQEGLSACPAEGSAMHTYKLSIKTSCMPVMQGSEAGRIMSAGHWDGAGNALHYSLATAIPSN